MQLIHTQAKRDGTTGLPIDDVVSTDSQTPSIAASLRGHSSAEPASKPATADFGNDSNSYLDIPAFLRRQAD